MDDRNPSGHTQVDGPTAVVDRDRTEANRTLVRTFKQVVTLELSILIVSVSLSMVIIIPNMPPRW